MRFREGIDLIRTSFGRRWLVRTVRKRLYSHHESVCLRRDLTVPFTPPPAKIPLTVRRLQPDDDLSFLDDEPGLSPEVTQLRTDQRWLIQQDLPAPWVAVDPDGKVCLMTYLFTAQDNPRVRALWGDWLPELKPDEAMIEGIYTADSHRGLGIMADAATRIAEQARDVGVRYGVGFIPFKNVASQRGGEKAGWRPYLRREEDWFLFRRRVRFFPIGDDPAN